MAINTCHGVRSTSRQLQDGPNQGTIAEQLELLDLQNMLNSLMSEFQLSNASGNDIPNVWDVPLANNLADPVENHYEIISQLVDYYHNTISDMQQQLRVQEKHATMMEEKKRELERKVSLMKQV